jgi:hypothetical protein
MNKSFDTGSILVILITFLLFASALFVKGFTHDLLLEAGVLLVSIKLIIMVYKTSTYHQDVKKELQEIKELLNK